MSETAIEDLDAAAISAIDPAALDRLEDAGLDVPSITGAIASLVGGRPRLQVDLTSPPSPFVAFVGGVAATAESADACVRGLASEVSSAVRARAEALGVDLSPERTT